MNPYPQYPNQRPSRLQVAINQLKQQYKLPAWSMVGGVIAFVIAGLAGSFLSAISSGWAGGIIGIMALAIVMLIGVIVPDPGEFINTEPITVTDWNPSDSAVEVDAKDQNQPNS